MTFREEILADGIRLICGDCRELLGTLPRDCACITDPPYGMNLAGISGGLESRAKYAALQDYIIFGDDEPFDPSPYLRFPKVILWGANHYASRLPAARKWLVWDKRDGGTSDNQADCELAWTNLAGPERLYSQKWRGMIRAGEENVVFQSYRCHPTQKPAALMRWCIEQVGDTRTILDPFMGSGTTGVAAVKLGRRFIGVEIEPRYFDFSCRRISEALRQPDLFIEKPKPAKQESFL